MLCICVSCSCAAWIYLVRNNDDTVTPTTEQSLASNSVEKMTQKPNGIDDSVVDGNMTVNISKAKDMDVKNRLEVR